MRYLFFCLISFLFYAQSNAQGCVAIRSNGGTCTMMPQHDAANHKALSNWTVSVNNRYFKSYKHFVGKEEQHERVEAGTEVINHFASTEFGISRNLNNRWSSALFVPIISNARRSTHSFGLGDARMAAYYWLLNSAKSSRANVQMGLELSYLPVIIATRIIFIRMTA